MNEVIQRLENIITACGVDFDDDRNIDIRNIDSVTFISVIVEIENEFCITFPDEYLSVDSLSSLNILFIMIKQETEKEQNGQTP